MHSILEAIISDHFNNMKNSLISVGYTSTRKTCEDILWSYFSYILRRISLDPVQKNEMSIMITNGTVQLVTVWKRKNSIGHGKSLSDQSCFLLLRIDVFEAIIYQCSSCCFFVCRRFRTRYYY